MLNRKASWWSCGQIADFVSIRSTTLTFDASLHDSSTCTSALDLKQDTGKNLLSLHTCVMDKIRGFKLQYPPKSGYPTAVYDDFDDENLQQYFTVSFKPCVRGLHDDIKDKYCKILFISTTKPALKENYAYNI